MKLEKLLYTYKGIIGSVALILFVLAGTIFGILPAIGKVKDIRDQSMELDQTNKMLQTKLNILDTVNEGEYRVKLNDLIAAVPIDKSFPSLFSTIDALSGSSGVTVSQLTLAKPGSIATSAAERQSAEERKIGSSLIPFTVTVIGSYEQIHSFLTAVVNVRRFFRVRNFDISFFDPTNITVTMGMDAFYSPLTSNIEASDKALEPFSESEERIIATIQKMPLAVPVSVGGPGSITPQQEAPRNDLFSPQ